MQNDPRWSAPTLAALAGLLLTVSCGSGGGGGGGGFENDAGDLAGSVIELEGAEGRFSLTPMEANQAQSPPPAMRLEDPAGNQYFRLEFPYRVDPSSLLVDDPLLAPYSYLNGNLRVTDAAGGHLPALVLLNGIDVFGTDRSGDAGRPQALAGGSLDRNLAHVDDDGVRKDVLLYIADSDGDLSTRDTFGLPEGETLHVRLDAVNGVQVEAAWSIAYGSADPQPPRVRRLLAERPDPDSADELERISTHSTFRIDFDEVVVPRSVGRSPELDGLPFAGNLPLPPANPPLPHVALQARVEGRPPLLIPYQCAPIGVNNLISYRLEPLVRLPQDVIVELVVRSVSGNMSSVSDLWGNAFDGEGDGLDAVQAFRSGTDSAVVNVPVSPEVIYYLPTRGPGLGAVDLNGHGFSTNTPGVNKDRPERAAIVTRFTQVDSNGCLTDFNASGIALQGHPYQPQNSLCNHNQFRYPVGLGGAAYGPGVTPGWADPTDPGNPGTPLPGVNEMSSGFETLCRDSAGSVNLTGSGGQVGNLRDLVVGEFLDLVYHDTRNLFAGDAMHVSVYGGNVTTSGRNTISDPPAPNPPPSRYWVGLSALDIVVDPDGSSAVVLESDEVFTGFRDPVRGLMQLRPSDFTGGPDQTIFPHRGVGPAVQSATQGFAFSARQQVGNFLFVTDKENRSVHVLNSNTMDVLHSLVLPDPEGLGISPDNGILFVSNRGDDSLSMVGADPTAPTFMQEIARIDVGRGPTSVAAQPDGEDVFVCNTDGNSISIVDPQTLSVRKQIDALISQPYDVSLTGRQGIGTGGSVFYGFAAGVYFGYISNFGANNLLVYESGPDGPQGIGFDNILGKIPESDDDGTFLEPRGLCASPFANDQGLYAGGVFLAHRGERGEGRVSHVQFTHQAIPGPLPRSAPPGFYIPPGFLERTFEVTGTWGAAVERPLAGRFPTDVTLADLDTGAYQSSPSMAPNFSSGFPPPFPTRAGFINSHHLMRNAGVGIPAWLPDRLYVSYSDVDTIQVLSPTGANIVLNTLEGTGGSGVQKLGAYWHQ